MKFLARLLLATAVYAGLASVNGVISSGVTSTSFILGLADAQAGGGFRGPGGKTPTGRGQPGRTGRGGRTPETPQTPPRFQRLEGENRFVSYIDDPHTARLVSQGIVEGQIDPPRVFEKMEFNDAVGEVRNLTKRPHGDTYASSLEHEALWRGMIECIPVVRAKFAHDLANHGTTFIFGELTSGRFDEVRFRILLTSYFMLGEQKDLARWAATASDFDLEDLHTRVYDRRILDGLFSNDDLTGDLLSPKPKNFPTKQTLDEYLKQRESLQRGKEDLPVPKQTATAGQGGSGGGKSSGGGGGFDDAAGAKRDLKLPPLSHSYHDARTKEPATRAELRLMLLDDNGCASDWRGKREIPFGEFSAVLHGKFAQGGVFHTREVAHNEAAFALLDRVKDQSATVLTFYGCPSTLRTASVQAPIAAVISTAQSDGRCAQYRPGRGLSEPSMICVESTWRRRGYDVRVVGRMAR